MIDEAQGANCRSARRFIAERVELIFMPEEIAKAVTFLAADGDYITGQQINVNGGWYL